MISSGAETLPQRAHCSKGIRTFPVAPFLFHQGCRKTLPSVQNQKSDSFHTLSAPCSSRIGGSSRSATSAVVIFFGSFPFGRQRATSCTDWNTERYAAIVSPILFVTGRGIHFAMRLSTQPRCWS